MRHRSYGARRRFSDEEFSKVRRLIKMKSFKSKEKLFNTSVTDIIVNIARLLSQVFFLQMSQCLMSKNYGPAVLTRTVMILDTEPGSTV